MRRDINGLVTFVVINDPFIRTVLKYMNNLSLPLLAEQQINISGLLSDPTEGPTYNRQSGSLLLLLLLFLLFGPVGSDFKHEL